MREPGGLHHSRRAGHSRRQGESGALQEITESEEFRELNNRILLNVDGLEWEIWAAGDEIGRIVGSCGKAVANL